MNAVRIKGSSTKVFFGRVLAVLCRYDLGGMDLQGGKDTARKGIKCKTRRFGKVFLCWGKAGITGVTPSRTFPRQPGPSCPPPTPCAHVPAGQRPLCFRTRPHWLFPELPELVPTPRSILNRFRTLLGLVLRALRSSHEEIETVS